MPHIPVLLNDVIENLIPADFTPHRILDGTFGRGGHSRAILKAFPRVQVVGLDRDHAALDFAKMHFSSEIEAGQLELVHGNFSDFKKIFNQQKFSAILLDLGVSSPQLDEGDRGFSFYHDGPLDMRMDQREELTAKDIVNTWSEQELSDLFYQLGEVKFPNKVVRHIIESRQEGPIETTGELSSIISKAMGWSKKGQHPATKFFLALRLKVNSELEAIEKNILDLIEGLEVGGRLLVITFHSLEDRIVKVQFKLAAQEGLGLIVNKKVIQAQWPEKKKNPRARSAKLRVFQKGELL